jgi:type I restriction enzyme S subunit
MEKLQPSLRFPEFKGDWDKMYLGDAFSIFNGYAFSSSDSVNEGILWVKIADVGIQEMKKDNISFLPQSIKNKFLKFESTQTYH